ncbi:hypothetical protein F5Y19DRAFT_469224 [Xylariaceae sp. FL1651]|nr:hypothetical protein F5Y19DRAFT_469224 [Xylariaceae sp. FL1651]
MPVPVMEHHRFPRRSASHGTLRGSYLVRSGSGIGPFPIRPLHKPLRSVNENSVLLPSPGALEGMLKTTTETGDIGIFTIKPVPPSPLQRDTFSETGHPCPRPRRSVDNLYRQNIARRLPSNRDTTSEVISIYGSDSLKSGTSTLSPNSTEDPGQRSYSMTTCGSRHLSHYRSTTTLQSQASGGSHLQRPRSPFPYPTRLKRPGVRTASPAVTENGQVDYSRMVEIDRVSYRTIHGHFKHGYSPVSRRPHPLGLRADANRSTPSLPLPGPPPNFHGPPRPPSVRTHSAASMASWNPSFRERLDSTSTRTSSLTSAANLYHRMPPTLRARPSGLSAPPPRYYDYTEDFENKPPRLTPPVQAYAPTPTRATQYSQSTLLQETDDHLAAVFGERDSAFFDYESQVVDGLSTAPVLGAAPYRSESRGSSSDQLASRCCPDFTQPEGNITTELEASENGSRGTRSSDIDLLPSQIGRSSIDTFNPSLDLETRDVLPSYSYVSYHASTAPKTKRKSPERHVQVLGGRTLTIRSEQGIIIRDDTQDEMSGQEPVGDCCSHMESRVITSEASEQNTKQTVEKEPVGSEAAHQHQAVSSGDGLQHYALSSLHNKGLALLAVLDSPKSKMSTSPFKVTAEEPMNDKLEKQTGSRVVNDTPEINQYTEFRRHKRNHAILRISTTDLPRDDNEGYPHIAPSCSTTPLISPKPISPARQLKVKNSIPQLMKALPPLPGDPGYSLPPSSNGVPEEDEYTDILIPFSFPESVGPISFNHLGITDLGPTAKVGVVPSPQRNGPKFRLKIKTNSCSDASDSLTHKQLQVQANLDSPGHASETEASDELGETHIRSHGQNKLKIRSPRRSRISAPPPSTIRRNPDVGTSQVVTDLMRRKPQDLFSLSPKPESMLLRKRRKPLSQPFRSETLTTSSTSDLAAVEERTIPFDCQVPSTLSSHPQELSRVGGDTLSRSRPSHGLQKRLSNLRAIFSSSPAVSVNPARITDSLDTDKTVTPKLLNANFDIKAPNKTTEPTTGTAQLRLGHRLRTTDGHYSDFPPTYTTRSDMPAMCPNFNFFSKKRRASPSPPVSGQDFYHGNGQSAVAEAPQNGIPSPGTYHQPLRPRAKLAQVELTDLKKHKGRFYENFDEESSTPPHPMFIGDDRGRSSATLVGASMSSSSLPWNMSTPRGKRSTERVLLTPLRSRAASASTSTTPLQREQALPSVAPQLELPPDLEDVPFPAAFLSEHWPLVNEEGGSRAYSNHGGEYSNDQTDDETTWLATPSSGKWLSGALTGL